MKETTDLIYVAKALQGIIRNADLYGLVLVKIPTLRFVIFYYGIENQPEQKILKYPMHLRRIWIRMSRNMRIVREKQKEKR